MAASHRTAADEAPAANLTQNHPNQFLRDPDPPYHLAAFAALTPHQSFTVHRGGITDQPELSLICAVGGYQSDEMIPFGGNRSKSKRQWAPDVGIEARA